jgi:RNA polymerase sigma-70 factor (ECF subfamily)
MLSKAQDLAANGLPAALLDACRVASARWPGCRMTPEAFAEYLMERFRTRDDGIGAFASLALDDLYLAAACATGDPAALAALERGPLAEVGAFVAHIDRSPAFADEVRQLLRERLLVPAPGAPGKPPKISEYAGRGPLGAWLRVAAVRAALNARRGTREKRRAAEVEARALRSPIPDPELDYLAARYGRELTSAFEATLAALPIDQRNVLRLHYLDGLGIDAIADLYRVHRSTAARWLERARRQVLEHTRRSLAERLALSSTELDSLIGLARSRLEITLSRVLAPAGS